MIEVPFNIPTLTGLENKYLLEVLNEQKFCGDGKFNRLVSENLSKWHCGAGVLLTPSCTAALELITLLIELGPGDEVVMPSFTFTSTATSVALRGAKPVFCDIDEDTLSIDLEKVQKLINSNTKAICVVNYAGSSCDLIEARRICDEHGIFLIEDAAQSLGSFYNGQPMGTFGDFSAISFHETKNIQCGEGGAIIINNKDFLERAEIIREKGTNRTNFRKGLVSKYKWLDHGSSFLLSELNAAFLFPQIRQISEIAKARLAQYDKYKQGLSNCTYLKLPSIEPNVKHNAHIFYVILKTQLEKERLQDYMEKNRILVTTHYEPLHLSPFSKKHKLNTNNLDVTERIAPKLLRLPLLAHRDDLTELIIHKLEQFS